jgi:integrase
MFGANPHYLAGKYGSPESLAEYEELRAKILKHKLGEEQQHIEPPTKRRSMSIAQVFLRYLQWAETYYDGGAKNKEFGHFVKAMDQVRLLYNSLPFSEFGPRKLRRVRERMIDLGWSRNHINHQVNRIRAVFKWAVSEEYIESTVHANLQTLPGLRKGKSLARETKPVKPVAWKHVEATLPFMTPVLAAMTEIKYLTGMRSDELTGMRLAEMDLRGDVWIYEPREHKTAHRGKRKVICLGPRSQALLLPYLPASLNAFIFSPGISCWEQSQARAAARKSKLYGKALNRQPRARKTRERYDTHAYQTAINHAFTAMAKSLGHVRPVGEKLRPWLRSVGIRFWTPHALRHSRGTLTRAAYGIEGAQASLGNTLEATQIYAEKSLDLAVRIARETS